jgi:hypothetical protein
MAAQDTRPSKRNIANAILCNMRGEHPMRHGRCGYCNTAKVYADEYGIYEIGMIEYELYMLCPRCKNETPTPCEAHAATAAKIGRLNDKKLMNLMKIHATFCFDDNCTLIRCNFYKKKLHDLFINDPLQVRPIINKLDEIM